MNERIKKIGLIVRRLEKRQALLTTSKRKSLLKSHSRKSTGDDFNLTEPSTNQAIPSSIPTQSKSTLDLQSFSGFGISIGLLLLILHIYLCYKLYTVDRDLHISDSDCRMTCEESK